MSTADSRSGTCESGSRMPGSRDSSLSAETDESATSGVKNHVSSSRSCASAQKQKHHDSDEWAALVRLAGRVTMFLPVFLARGPTLPLRVSG